jgi:ABC-type bacteriocin/lantibiotic exporter with double-glycine peptidase domain
MNLRDGNSEITKVGSFLKLFSTAKWILGKRHTKILLIASFCQIIIALLDILFLALVGPLIISFSEQTNSNNKFLILGRFTISNDQFLIWIVLIVLVKNFAGLLVQRIVLSSFANREAEVGTVLVQSSLFGGNNNYQMVHSTGLLQSSTFMLRLIFGSLFRPSIAFIGEISTILAVIFGLLIINTQVAIMSICFFSIFGYLMIWYTGKKQQIIGNKSLDVERASLRALTEIQLMNRELRFAHKDLTALVELNNFRMKFAKLNSNYTFLNAIPRHLLEVIFLFGIGFLVLFLDYSQRSQQVFPILALLIAAGYRILPSLNYITIATGNFRSTVASLRHIDSLGRRIGVRFSDLTFKEIRSVEQNKQFAGDLHLENVFYQYPISKKTILCDFNLVIKEGTTLLIQGLSGSGKTTLIALVTGSLTPQKGRIYAVDGNKEFVMDQTVMGISYLSQDVPLLDESFAYNIALEEPLEKNLKRLKDAANKAGILGCILESSMGFYTQIGENGALLSAGERQRLGIARSLYFQPSLLILDEPTANLDPVSESMVWDTLAKIKGQCTILVVSHRSVPEKIYDEKINLKVFPNNNLN